MHPNNCKYSYPHLGGINLPKQVVELGFGHSLTPVPLFLIITLTYHYPYDCSIKSNGYIKNKEVQ